MTMPDQPTAYDILRIRPDATIDEIKAAIRKGQRAHHPDVAGEGHEQTYLEITEAGEMLLDETRRAEYDASLMAEPAEPETQIAKSTRSLNDGPEQISVLDVGPQLTHMAFASVIGFAAAALVCELTWTHRLLLGAVALGLGFEAGWRGRLAGPSRASMRRSATSSILSSVMIASLPIMLAIGVVFSRAQVTNTGARVALSALPLALGMAVAGLALGSIAWRVRFDRSIITAKALREGAWFGAEHGGAEGAYLGRELTETAGPNVRVFQIEHAIFTHAVVAGSRAILLRYVDGPNGAYSLSADSLLVTRSSGAIDEVMRMSLDASVREIAQGCSPSGRIEAFIVVPETASSNDARVIRLDQVAGVIDSDDAFVNRSLVIDLMLALTLQRQVA